MDKSKLLFHAEYEDFYDMVEDNKIFSKYCKEVFGIDFSQDGYSDLTQIKDMMKIADIRSKQKVLDVGCGNGKMAEYIAKKMKSVVYGFDYSENAIYSAKIRTARKKNLFFETGVIGEKEYEPESFDVILAVDTVYFALDMDAFIGQIYEWLKPQGCFLAFYEEGYLKGISKDEDQTDLAFAFRKYKLPYEVVDYTEQHYKLLKHKRNVITQRKDLFLEHGMEFYYHCAMETSIEETMGHEEFKEKYRRYLYIMRK